MNASTRSLLLMVVGSAIVAIAFSAAVRAQLHPAVLVALSAVAIAVLAGGMIHWWRTADEAVREAHKFAWFWGATAGLTLLLPGLVLLSQMPEVIERIRPEGYPQVAFGVLLTLLLQLIGYLVTWGVWWARRR